MLKVKENKVELKYYIAGLGAVGLLIFGIYCPAFLNKKDNSVLEFKTPVEYEKALVLKVFNGTFTIKPLYAQAVRGVSEKENVMKYIDAYQNTDVVRTEYADKIKEDIILKQPGHPDRFMYQLNIAEFEFSKNEDNSIVFYPRGEANELHKLFTIPAPFMIDADGKTSSVEEVEMKITPGGILTITPNKDWLAGAAYPVILDPTIEISILNVHSHPQEGENWKVAFLTLGAADLKIIPDDQPTIDDDEFISLTCEGEVREPQLLAGDVIFYPDWSCPGIAEVIHYTKKAGHHRLRFEFGGQVAYAYNSPTNWGRMSAGGSSSGGTNFNFCMGGITPDIDGMRMTSASVYLISTDGDDEVRLAVYQGGSLSAGPAGATLLYDFGTTHDNGDSGFETLSASAGGIALPRDGIVWICSKGNSGASFDYGAVDTPGDFQMATGRFNSTSIGEEEQTAYLDTFPSGGSFNTFWYTAYLTYDTTTVATNSETDADFTAATLNSALDIGAFDSIDTFFEYGLTGDYGATTTPIATTTDANPSENLSGLNGLATYHFRGGAVSTTNFYYGADRVFMTGDFSWSEQTTSDFSSGTLSNTASTSINSLILDTTADIRDSESFEVDLGDWINASGDDIDWTRDSGGTPSGSGNTGPTTGSDGSYYMYTEASNPNYPRKTANLEYDLSGAKGGKVTFDYHMYSLIPTAMGVLKLQAYNGASWVDLWEMEDSQGSVWHSDTVYFPSNSTKIRFRGRTGESLGWQSDMAIDNVKVYATQQSSGYRIAPAIDAGSITKAESSKIEWSGRTPANTSLIIYTAISASNTTAPEVWDAVSASGDTIPSITSGDNLTGKYLWIKQALATTDTNVSPELYWLTLGITQGTGEIGPSITSASDSPDPLVESVNITFEADWSIPVSEGIKMYVCKTNDISTTTLGCTGGAWCSNSNDWDTTDPISCSYTAQNADIATSPNNYYIFVCDDDVSCSASYSGVFTVSSWYNFSWPYRKSVTINSSLVQDNFTDFPVLATTTDSDLAGKARADGFDIVFTAADGTTVLNYEREKFNSGAGELAAWIQTDLSASSDTVLYMYYGNASQTTDMATTTGVWDDNYLMVHHLNEASGAINDSTENNNDSSVAAGMTYQSAGEIGDSLFFDEVNDYYGITDFDYGDTFTISMWLKHDGNNAGSAYNYFYSHDVVSTNPNINLYIAEDGASDADDLIAHIMPNSGNEEMRADVSAGDTNVTNGAWYYVTLRRVRNGASNIYINAVSQASYSSTDVDIDPEGLINIGRRQDGNADRYFGGNLDEIRLSNTNRSLAWITTEYYNQGGTPGFTAFGSELQISGSSAPSISSVSDSPDPAISGQNITFSVDWNDADAEGVKMFICKTDSIETSGPSCPGGEWCANSNDWDTTDPITCTYTMQADSREAQNYYAFVCDDEVSCSSSSSGAFNLTYATKINTSLVNKYASGLVGYWTFDGADMNGATAYDRSGQSNNGALTNGPKPVKGISGQALEFDGVDDYVDLPNNSILQVNDSYSVFAWAKVVGPTVDANQRESVVGRYFSSDYIQYDYDLNGGTWKFDITTLGTNPAVISITSPSSIRAWTQVGYVYNGSNITVYINGTENTSAVATGESQYYNQKWQIGDNGSGPDYQFNGQIDEVRVYNRALSPSEILDLYQVGARRLKPNATLVSKDTDGLVGYWTFNGADMDWSAATAEVLDRSGRGNNGDAVNGLKAIKGVSGQALSFDGADDYVKTSSVISINTTYTTSVWFKYTGGSGLRTIFHRGDANSCYYEPYFAVDASSNLKVKVSGCGDSGLIDNSYALAENNWYNAILVVNGNSQTLYINGNQAAIASRTPNNDTDWVAVMGARSVPSDELFTGLIDEVRVYNRALSADEVLNLYQTGARSMKLRQ